MNASHPIAQFKSYSAYKPSGVVWLGDIPEHWGVPRGKALLIPIDIRSSTGDEELLTVSARHGVIPRESASVTMFKAESYAGYKLCWPGDLVINSLWAWAHGLGVSRHHGIVSSAYGVYRPLPKVDARFVHLLVRSVPFQWELQVRSKGIWLSRLQLTDEAFLGAPIPLPPLPEQRSIVRYLDYVDRRIRRYVDAKRKLIALLEEERKNSTHEAIQSLDTRSHRLEAVASLVARPIERSSVKTYIPIGLYNRGRGMFRKELRSGNELGDSSFFWVKEGDLVISGQFAWEGAIALATGIEDGCVASHRYPILRGKPGILDSGFLLSFFQTAWGQLLLDHHSRGAAGRNRPLNIRTLLKEAISLPPLESQSQISEMLQRESYVRQQVRLSEQLLMEYRTRLIADVVTGRLDVRDAAAQLPDEAEDDVPIGEGGPQQNGFFEGPYDAEKEPAIADEVTT